MATYPDWWHETDVIPPSARQGHRATFKWQAEPIPHPSWAGDLRKRNEDDLPIHALCARRYKTGLKPEDYKETTVEQMLEDQMGDYVTHSKDFGRTWSEPRH